MKLWQEFRSWRLGKVRFPSRRRVVTACAAVLLLTGTLFITPSYVGAARSTTASITLSPTSGSVGTVVSVSGTGFQSGETVKLSWGSAGVGSSTASNRGAFSASFTVPPTPGGSHTVVATGESSGLSASAVFTVTAALTLKTTGGPPGTKVKGAVSGFGAAETVSLTFPASVAVVTSAITNPAGSATLTFTVPPETNGNYTALATGAASGLTAVSSFAVLAGISLTPASGPVGTSVTVAGGGFGANEAVGIAFGSTTGVATATTDANGSFTEATFSVPAGTTDGSYAVTATGATSGVTTSANFTVTPVITLSPAKGPIGQAVTINGAGFQAGEFVDIDFGNLGALQYLVTATANAAGAFTAGMKVPSELSGPGVYTVTATGRSSLATASAPFTITGATITLKPSTGPSGTSVTVSGTGFASSETVDVYWDSLADQVTTATSNASGSFTATFDVPTPTNNGSHTVIAAGTTLDQATAAFTVGPQITLAPTNGGVGSTVTVTGSGFSAGEDVGLAFDTTAVGTTVAGTSGDISTTFTVPQGVLNGPHTVTATGLSSKLTGKATFTVGAVIKLKPASAAPGASVTVTGSGFHPTEAVSLSFNGTALTPAAPITTDNQGGFTASFTVPATIAGSDPVVATGASGATGDQATATLSVKAALTLTPLEGRPGNQVQVSGQGFGADETVTLTDTEGDAIAAPLTNSVGSFSAVAFSMSGSVGCGGGCLGSGPVTVTGVGSASAQKATVQYLVNDASISVTPTSGGTGTTVTLTGSGFGDLETVNVTFQTHQVLSVTTDSAGNLPTSTFNVPGGLAKGNYTVTATGTSDCLAAGVCLTATAPFTVTRGITVSPSNGSPGQNVTVNGSGFAKSESVTVSLGNAAEGTSTVGTAKVNRSGSFSLSFAVPATPGGAYTVTANGTTGDSATAPFTVKPGVTLSPTNGPTGTTVTVSGGGFAANDLLTIGFGAVANEVATATADGTGSFTASFNVASGVQAGTYNVIAAGQTGPATDEAQAPFTVTGAAITVSPQTGTATFSSSADIFDSSPLASTVTVTGTNFGKNESVGVTFNGQPVATATTDRTGAFTVTFAVPDVPNGPYPVVATGATSGDVATGTFTVGPALGVPTYNGSVPTGVLGLDGTGFAAGETINLAFGGPNGPISLGSATAGSDGTFATTWTVPIVPGPGPYPITATGATGDSATIASFTIICGGYYAPTSGPPGTTVTISSLGYGDQEVVTTVFGSTVVAETISQANGSVTTGFTVPADYPPGTYSVVSTGQTTGMQCSGQVGFTVTGTTASPNAGTGSPSRGYLSSLAAVGHRDGTGPVFRALELP